MTALAMIIGMVPMALGLGEAGEQNAPLGRAVIGGLIVATIATLFIVPIFYTLLRRKPPTLHMLDARFAAEAAGCTETGKLRMARRGRFAFVSALSRRHRWWWRRGIGGVRLWQTRTRSLSASREALADGVARGPVVQVATVDARARRSG